MQSSDEALDSLTWEEHVDWSLGRARRVLDYATEQFLAGTLDEAESPATLAEAWRDLASAWEERQRHELELASAFPDEEEEYEEDEAEAELVP